MSAPVALAGTVGPITFEEPEFPLGTVVDGFSTSTLNGSAIPTLSFAYTISGSPSTDATISGGPGTLMFVQDPGIEGPTGGALLTVDFGADVTDAQFGFALSCEPGTISPGVSVTALDASGSTVGTASTDAVDTGFGFPENQTSVAFGGTPFRAMELQFNQQCGAFLFDNLQYTSLAVPGLPTVAVLGLVTLLAVAGWVALRMRGGA